MTLCGGSSALAQPEQWPLTGCAPLRRSTPEAGAAAAHTPSPRPHLPIRAAWNSPHTHTRRCSLYNARSVLSVSLFISACVLLSSSFVLFLSCCVCSSVCLALHASCFLHSAFSTLFFSISACFPVPMSLIYTFKVFPPRRSLTLSLSEFVRNVTCQGQPQWSAVNQPGMER